MEKKKLTAKDFITLGIFSVLFVVLCYVGIFAMSLLVVTQPFGVALGALLGGVVYMYMRAKVQGFGGILITGAILAIAMFATGSGWVIAVCVLAGALISELVVRGGGYKNFWLTTAGYVILMVVYAAGSYAPMLIMKDSYYELAMSNSVDDAFMIDLLDFYTGPVLFAALAATAICAVTGSLIARAMMKKHFIKAGMVSGAA